MGAKETFEHFWQPERPLLVEYWTLVGGGGLLWATVVMSPWIICLIKRLKHFIVYFTPLLYLHSGSWSDNLILLSIYHNCLRLKANVEHYRATGSNNGAGFTAYRMCWFLHHLDCFTFQCNVWLLFLRLLEIFSTEQCSRSPSVEFYLSVFWFWSVCLFKVI